MPYNPYEGKAIFLGFFKVIDGCIKDNRITFMHRDRFTKDEVSSGIKQMIQKWNIESIVKIKENKEHTFTVGSTEDRKSVEEILKIANPLYDTRVIIDKDYLSKNKRQLLTKSFKEGEEYIIS